VSEGPPDTVPEDIMWREPWAERGADITTEGLDPGWDSRAAELAQGGSLDPEEL